MSKQHGMFQENDFMVKIEEYTNKIKKKKFEIFLYRTRNSPTLNAQP